jgi:hypothetical protein
MSTLVGYPPSEASLRGDRAAGASVAGSWGEPGMTVCPHPAGEPYPHGAEPYGCPNPKKW